MSRTHDGPSRAPAGPLAVEWQTVELPPVRAGVETWATVEFRNVGTVTWHPPDDAERGIWLSFHWLDRRGNAIVWEGRRQRLRHPLHPGEAIAQETAIRGPIPPGPYRLAFDLVDEGRCWFADVGNEPLELDVDVQPRLLERSLAATVEDGPSELVELTRAALARQEEAIVEVGSAVAYLAAGCAPRADWSRRILDAHDEGYAAVGGSVNLTGGRPWKREARRALAPWKPGFGRKPNWSLPLLMPSLTEETREWIALDEPFAGLPAVDLTDCPEPWLCDGRIVVAVPVRAVQQVGRRPAGTRAQPQ